MKVLLDTSVSNIQYEGVVINSELSKCNIVKIR